MINRRTDEREKKHIKHCWLALEWNHEICELRSFWLIWLSLTYFFQLILITVSFIRSFIFKGCSWWPIPAHPRSTNWHYHGILEFASSRAVNCFAKPHISICQSNFTTLSFMRSFPFKGCSWRLIPAHLDRHKNGIAEFVGSKAFVWYAAVHITFSDQVHGASSHLASWRLFLAFIETTVLVAKWFWRIFEPPVHYRCSRYTTNNIKVISKELYETLCQQSSLYSPPTATRRNHLSPLLAHPITWLSLPYSPPTRRNHLSPLLAYPITWLSPPYSPPTRKIIFHPF